MFCQKCGFENPAGVKLCQSCSWVLAGTAGVEENQNARTSGLAITALVLTVLCFFTFFLTALPAIIFGIVALVKIEKSCGRLKGKGLAIAGIAAPALMLPVAAVLLAILMPALAKVKVHAQKLVCQTNLKGMANAISYYSLGYDGELPTASKWCDLLVEYSDAGPESFKCKGAPVKGASHYVMNPQAQRLGTDAPDDMVLLFETDEPGWNLVGGKEMLSPANHKGKGCNVLFINGQVRFVSEAELEQLRWSDQSPGQEIDNLVDLPD